MTNTTPAPRRHLTPAAIADLADVPAVSRWYRCGPIRLHALDYGGPGQAVVIVPGITMPAIGMDFVARELTPSWRPIVLDTRGRGFSDRAGSYALDDYASDVEALIQALGLESPVLMGHSMGARIAAVTATRGRVRLAGTVIVDPPVSGPGRGSYPTPLHAFLEQLAQAQRGTSADEVGASWPAWPRRELALRARWLSSCDDDAIRATHAGFEREDFFSSWPRVPAPTVLIRGADSPVVSPGAFSEAGAANPSATLATVPGAGHMVFWDNPVPALEAARAALTSCATAPGRR